MPSRSRVVSPRAFALLAALVTLGVFGVGTATSGTAAPAKTAAHQSAGKLSSPGPNGNTTPLLLSWSGRAWVVSHNGEKGPEKAPLTNSTRAVWVDSRGRLHLHIIKINGVWRSVQLKSLYPVSYGTYRLINDTATARFAPQTVFGMFVYRPGTKTYTNEIDVENSRFPRYLKPPNNAQFAVQPYNAPHHEHAYHVKPSYVPLFQQFTWYAPTQGNGAVKFEARVGTTPHSPLLTRWTYYGYSTPVANNMHLYINLWLNHNQPPRHGTHTAVLRSLTVTPLN
ncbi:MAG: hypothetical protein ACTHK4_02255 [Mycobacteriales bacterium]